MKKCSADSSSVNDKKLVSPSHDFSYNVIDSSQGINFGHQETKRFDFTEGSYYVLLPDGKMQTVIYRANENGYYPVVSYSDIVGSDGQPASYKKSSKGLFPEESQESFSSQVNLPEPYYSSIDSSNKEQVKILPNLQNSFNFGKTSLIQNNLNQKVDSNHKKNKKQNLALTYKNDFQRVSEIPFNQHAYDVFISKVDPCYSSDRLNKSLQNSPASHSQSQQMGSHDQQRYILAKNKPSLHPTASNKLKQGDFSFPSKLPNKIQTIGVTNNKLFLISEKNQFPSFKRNKQFSTSYQRPQSLHNSYDPPSDTLNLYQGPQTPYNTYEPPSNPSTSFEQPQSFSNLFNDQSNPSTSYDSLQSPSNIYDPPSEPSTSYQPPQSPSTTYSPLSDPPTLYQSPQLPSNTQDGPSNSSHSHDHSQSISNSFKAPFNPSTSYESLQSQFNTYEPSADPSTLYEGPQSRSNTYDPLSDPSTSYQRPRLLSNTYDPPSNPSNSYQRPQSPSNTNDPSSNPSTSYQSPQSPSNTYDPPSDPSTSSQSPQSPSNTYDPSSDPSTSYQRPQLPSNTYDPPSDPSTSYQSPQSPSNTYDPSSDPSTSYQRPQLPSNTYDPSSNPSTSYQRPQSASNTNDPTSDPSTAYQSPQLPSNTYDPPSDPSTSYQSPQSPSNTYDPTSDPSTAYQSPQLPSNTYDPPSDPSTSYQSPQSPSNTYDPSSHPSTSYRSSQSPSNTYDPPSDPSTSYQSPLLLSNTYDPPSDLSTSYQSPQSPSNTNDPWSDPSTSYQSPQSPSNTYDPPSDPSTSYKSPQSPSNTYDPPSDPSTLYQRPQSSSNTRDWPSNPSNSYQRPQSPSNAKDPSSDPSTSYQSPQSPSNTYDPPSDPSTSYQSPQSPSNTYDPPSDPLTSYQSPQSPSNTRDWPSNPLNLHEQPKSFSNGLSNPSTLYKSPQSLPTSNNLPLNPLTTYDVPFGPHLKKSSILSNFMSKSFASKNVLTNDAKQNNYSQYKYPTSYEQSFGGNRSKFPNLFDSFLKDYFPNIKFKPNDNQGLSRDSQPSIKITSQASHASPPPQSAHSPKKQYAVPESSNKYSPIAAAKLSNSYSNPQISKGIPNRSKNKNSNSAFNANKAANENVPKVNASLGKLGSYLPIAPILTSVKQPQTRGLYNFKNTHDKIPTSLYVSHPNVDTRYKQIKKPYDGSGKEVSGISTIPQKGSNKEIPSSYLFIKNVNNNDKSIQLQQQTNSRIFNPKNFGSMFAGVISDSFKFNGKQMMKTLSIKKNQLEEGSSYEFYSDESNKKNENGKILTEISSYKEHNPIRSKSGNFATFTNHAHKNRIQKQPKIIVPNTNPLVKSLIEEKKNGFGGQTFTTLRNHHHKISRNPVSYSPPAYTKKHRQQESKIPKNPRTFGLANFSFTNLNSKKSTIRILSSVPILSSSNGAPTYPDYDYELSTQSANPFQPLINNESLTGGNKKLQTSFAKFRTNKDNENFPIEDESSIIRKSFSNEGNKKTTVKPAQLSVLLPKSTPITQPVNSYQYSRPLEINSQAPSSSSYSTLKSNNQQKASKTNQSSSKSTYSEYQNASQKPVNFYNMHQGTRNPTEDINHKAVVNSLGQPNYPINHEKNIPPFPTPSSTKVDEDSKKLRLPKFSNNQNQEDNFESPVEKPKSLRPGLFIPSGPRKTNNGFFIASNELVNAVKDPNESVVPVVVPVIIPVDDYQNLNEQFENFIDFESEYSNEYLDEDYL